MSDTKLREKADALIAFTQQGPRFIAWVEAVTDSIAPAPKKVAKVETGTVPCPNCGVLGLDEYDHRKLDQFGTAFDKGGGFTCQPAPPEPAAREMPEAVKWAIYQLRQNVRLWEIHGEQPASETDRKTADALESWWRNLAQPVAVGMTEELRMILDVAESRAEDQRHDGLLECSRNLERAIAAVRQQAAQGRKVELGKVRELVNDLKRALSEAAPSEMTMLDPHEWRSDLAAVFAELDAAEGKRRE